jgi:alkyl hydroperoxide reductase subunit AhpC
MASLRISYPSDPNAKSIKAISFKKDIVQFFLEASPISVISVDSFSNVKISGSKSHDAYTTLKALLSEVNAKSDILNKQYGELYQKKDKEGMAKLEAQFDALDLESKEIHKQYVLGNPKSPIALYAVGQFAGWDMDAEKVEPLFNALPKTVKESIAGKEMSTKIATARKTGVGAMAMDFTQNDTAGVPVALASFRGKYLLVDFWASWCGPCRAENPNVVKAYHQFKDKGFNVLGVSLDQPNAKDKWLKAIHDDQLAWTQVSDLKYWKNDVAVLYGIQAIPQNFLIDPQGKIVGKNLRGEELVKKLEALLK